MVFYFNNNSYYILIPKQKSSQRIEDIRGFHINKDYHELTLTPRYLTYNSSGIKYRSSKLVVND